MASGRIAEAERDQLLAGLAACEPFALAVSGGADSMALMHLVAGWLADTARSDAVHSDAVRSDTGRSDTGRSRSDCVVLTVDHGLRPGSDAEAEWVAARARALGIMHTTLRWTGEKPASGLQEAARAARYRLLVDYARREGLAAICLAHTRDDQAETVLMRLARGSGIDGLAAMTARGRRSDFAILRPLLGVPHGRLVATLEALGAEWLEDPSNEDMRFERVRIRRLMPRLAEAGLTAEAIALSAVRLGRARRALEAATDRWIGEAVRLDKAGFASIGRARLLVMPEEIALRALGRVLRAVGGRDVARYPIRLAKLESLLAAIRAVAPVALTLAGCLIRSIDDGGDGGDGGGDGGGGGDGDGDGGIVRLFREPGRAGLPVLALRPGESALWDNRFEVSAPGSLDGPLEVRALGEGEARSQLRRKIAEAAILPPGEALATLPAFWQNGDLVAVPTVAHFTPGLRYGGGVCGRDEAACTSRFIGALQQVGDGEPEDEEGGFRAPKGGRS